jgi:uncharacterized protein DUF6232
MLTFYNHRGIRVTDEYVAVDGRRYAVRDLHEVRTTRGPYNRTVVRALGGGVSLIAMAILLTAVMPVLMTAAIGLTGLLAVGSAFVLSRVNPRELTLWATFRGTELMLLVTRDSIEVGKLTRALRRALESDARSAMSY